MRHDFWTNQSSRGDGMSSAATIDHAREIARSLEAKEQQRAGSKDLARSSIASKLGIGRGTYDNLIRGRIKRLDVIIRDRLHALLMRELETEIARLSHELEIHRQCGTHLDSGEVGEVETHLAAAKAILNRSAE